jgi:hypothetical protein
VAATAFMTTAGGAFGMTTGTAFTAIVMTIPLNGIADVNDAQARFTSAFHLSHGSHDRSPFIDTIGSILERVFTLNILMHEHKFRYKSMYKNIQASILTTPELFL